MSTINKSEDIIKINFSTDYDINSLISLNLNNMTENNNPIMFTYGFFDISRNDLRYIDLNDFEDKLNGPFISHADIKNNTFSLDFKIKDDDHAKFTEKCNITNIEAYAEQRKTETNNIEEEYWEDYIKKAKNSFCLPQREVDYTNKYDNGDEKLTVLSVNLDVVSAIKTKYPSLVNLIVMVMFYPKTYFTPGDSQRFYTKRVEFEVFSLETDKIKLYYASFQKTKTERDYSEFFFPNVIEDEFITADKVFLQGEANRDIKGIPCLLLYLNKNPFSVIYSFKYTSISDVISSLGGSFDLIFVVFQIIHNYITTFNYKAYLLNSIFSFHCSNIENNAIYNKINTFVLKNQTTRRNSKFPEITKAIESPEKIKENQEEAKNDESGRKINDSLSVDIERKENKSIHIHQIELQNNLRPSIQKLVSNRTKYEIKPYDVLTAYINQLRKKPSEKDKIILLSESIIEEQIDYAKILKNSFDLFILKEAFIEKPFSNYITLPSLSISNTTPTISLLEEFQNDRGYEKISEELINELILKDLDKHKYSKILKQIIDFT